MPVSVYALALLEYLVADVAKVVASVAFLGAGWLGGVDGGVALVVRTGRASNRDLNAHVHIVGGIFAYVLSRGGVIAHCKGFLPGPLPVGRQRHALGADVVCLNGRWHIGCVLGFVDGKHAVCHHKQHLGKVGVGVAEIVCQKAHGIRANCCAACRSSSAEGKVVLSVNARFIFNINSVTTNALLCGAVSNSAAVACNGYHNVGVGGDGKGFLNNCATFPFDFCVITHISVVLVRNRVASGIEGE